MHDIRIVNARLIDGSGSAAKEGELAVKDGRIAAIGPSVGAARQEIDARGHVLCPGFIDLHNHADAGPVMNYLQQGATTILTGNCGFNVGDEIDIAAYGAKCRATPCGPNIATFIGHNSVRVRVLGRANRAPAQAELDAMKRLVAEGMAAGAVGLSTGLAYAPGCYADTEEVVALAQAAAPYGGFYASHMRNEGEGLMDSLHETLHIGRESGLPVQVSHLKLRGAAYWHRAAEALEVLDTARREGVDVTADQYPYSASCGRMQLLFPNWFIADDAAAIRARLADPALRARVHGEVSALLHTDYGGDLSRVVVSLCMSDPSIEGRSLGEISRMRGRGETLADGAETALELLHVAPADRSLMCVYHNICEEDIAVILKSPHVMVGSDGWYIDFGKGAPHPRSYGTFPRVLGRYAREQGLLSLEEAIRKMTSLPARRLGLADRGILAEGAWADLVVFDPDTVIDRATFKQPHQYPTGIDYVIVNGRLALDHGAHTGALAGRFLPRVAKA